MYGDDLDRDSGREVASCFQRFVMDSQKFSWSPIPLPPGAGAAASGAVGVRPAGVPPRVAAYGIEYGMSMEKESMELYIWETVWMSKPMR